MKTASATTSEAPKAAKPSRETPKQAPIDFVPFEILSCTPHVRQAAAAGAADTKATDPADESDPDVFDIVLCNSTPVDRGYAQLTWLMKKSAADMSYAKNGLSLLLEHGIRDSGSAWSGLIDPSLHIGIIENLAVDEQKEQLTGAIRFSRSDLGQQIKRDVKDGIRRFVSAGLIKLKWKLTKAATTPDELDQYLVTRWRPVEGSIVSVPAIPTALIKNSAAGQEYPVELEVDPPATEEPVMRLNNVKLSPDGGGGGAASTATPTPEVSAPGGVERQALAGGQAAIDAAVQTRNKQISEIVKLCSDQGCSGRASEFIEKGLTVESAALEILKAKSNAGTLKGISAELREGLTAKERKQWSFCRALDQLCEGTIDGVEGEVHQHMKKRAEQMGLPTKGGLMIPHDLRDLPGEYERRSRIVRQAMVSNVGTKGGEFVLDSQGGFIEFLANQSVAARLGAEVMNDLVGNIPFTKQQGDVTVFFVGENPSAAVAKSDMASGLVTMVAKTMQGGAQASRQLLRLASYGYEDKLMRSFARAHALALDRQGFHGSGAGGQCTGIYVAPDVTPIACGSVAVTYQKLLDHLSAVGVANGLVGNLGFVTTIQEAARLKNQYRQTNTFTPLWEGRLDDGTMEGYRAIASNQISATLGAGANEHGFIFGNWAELIYGMWGGLEIIIDNLTAAGQGMVNYTSFQMGDVILRHGQSFAKGTAVTLAP